MSCSGSPRQDKGQKINTLAIIIGYSVLSIMGAFVLVIIIVVILDITIWNKVRKDYIERGKREWELRRKDGKK